MGKDTNIIMYIEIFKAGLKGKGTKKIFFMVFCFVFLLWAFCAVGFETLVSKIL